MPLDDAPQIPLLDRIFADLFTLAQREPQTFELLHRLILTASQMVGWDGERSRLVKTDGLGRLELAPITVAVAAPVEATVLLTDGFEGAFNWSITGIGTDYEGERRAEATFQGDYGLYLRTRATGSAADDWVEGYRQASYFKSRKVKASLRFNLHDLGHTKYLDLMLFTYDETGQYKANIRWDKSAGVWQYLNSAGGYTTIPELPATIDVSLWAMFEVEVDGEAHHYRSVSLFGERVDLSGIEYYRIASTPTGRQVSPAARVTASDDLRPRLYIDDVLVREVL